MESKKAAAFLAILFLPLFLACQAEPTAPEDPQQPAGPSQSALNPTLTIFPSVLNLRIGEEGHFTAEFQPYVVHAQGPSPEAIRWISMDPDIARIDDSGKTRGLARGMARIRAQGDEFLATAWVRVK